MVSPRLVDYLKKRFRRQPKLLQVDARMAKHFIKHRPCLMLPNLREDPQKLEAANQALNLEPREGSEEGDAGVFFEMRIPR